MNPSNFKDEDSYLMLCNTLGKLKGDKVPILNENCNNLIVNPFLESNAVNNSASVPIGYGMNTNESFQQYVNASLSNCTGGNAILNSFSIPQMLTSSNFSINEIFALQKKQHEQSILIENATSMISRLVEENEMKNNRIHKLESELSSVSKTLDYCRKILSDKIQDCYEGNRMNSRQQFANLYHNGSKEISSEPLDFSENKSVMFSTEDHNHHSLASVLNSKMSKIPESSEGSNLNDYNEISVVESIQAKFNSNINDAFQENSGKKEIGISIYNPSNPSARPEFHRSIMSIKSMTCSEADAKKGCIDELNSTLQHFANESEEQINFDSGSSKSISNCNESKCSDKNKKNKKRQDKKTNEVNEEIGKAARMRPKKKETNGEKKEESKSKRMNKQVDKKSKFVMSGFDSIAARNNRNKEGKSDQSYDSDMKNSKIRNIKYFENLEYTEK